MVETFGNNSEVEPKEGAFTLVALDSDSNRALEFIKPDANEYQDAVLGYWTKIGAYSGSGHYGQNPYRIYELDEIPWEEIEPISQDEVDQGQEYINSLKKRK